jgi:hypothetical protein
MNEPTNPPADPRHEPHKEYEDHHFHDEDEIVPADDEQPRGPRPPGRRRPARRPPPRRYPED